MWDEVTNALTVCVWDTNSRHSFALAAVPDRALDVFRHPYSYAAAMGIPVDRVYVEAA
jgi:hypothetical protein